MNYFENVIKFKAKNKFFRDLARKQRNNYLSNNAILLFNHLFYSAENYFFNIKNACKTLNLTRYKISLAIQELKEQNYLIVEKVQDINGRFYGYVFKIFEYRKNKEKTQFLNQNIKYFNIDIPKTENILKDKRNKKENNNIDKEIIYNNLNDIIKINIKINKNDNNFLTKPYKIKVLYFYNVETNEFIKNIVEIKTKEQETRIKIFMKSVLFKKIERIIYFYDVIELKEKAYKTTIEKMRLNFNNFLSDFRYKLFGTRNPKEIKLKKFISYIFNSENISKFKNFMQEKLLNKPILDI